MDIAGHPWFWWASFLGFVGVMLALDLGFFHRQAHVVKMREALTWSVVWIGLALVFNVGILFFWQHMLPAHAIGPQLSNHEAAMAFLAGYLIEKALSVDNIFVFIMVFSYFRVPAQYQHRVLFFGILGALIFRAVFIALGAAVIERFAWTMVLFGLFLIFTGVKMVYVHGKQIDPEANPVIRMFKRFVPVTPDYVGQKFFTRIDGRLWATPLFVTLLFIELTDIIFAVDSIPAIFAITNDPLIVFTSNVFAILGLRALFFAIAGLMQLFHYLHYGLSAILVFVGGKMLYGYLTHHWLTDWHELPVAASLGVIALILIASIAVSVLFPPARTHDETLNLIESAAK